MTKPTTTEHISLAVEELLRLNLPVTQQAVQKLTSLSLSSIKRHQAQLSIMTPVLGNIYGVTTICAQEVVSFSEVALRRLCGAGKDEFDLPSMLGMLIGVTVRGEGYLETVTRYDRVGSFGSDFASLYVKVMSGESNRANHISSRTSALRNVAYERGFGHWFIKLPGYEVGIASKEYRVTPYAESIWCKALSMLAAVDFECRDIKSDYKIELSELVNIKPRDVIALLSVAEGVAGGYLLFTNQYKPSVSDVEGRTRVYGAFASLSGDTRLKMGLISYDVSACFQSILLAGCHSSVVTVETEKLLANPRSYREAMIAGSNVSYEDMKRGINAIAFSNTYHYTSLEPYFLEQKAIKQSFISMAMMAEDDRYDYACELVEKKRSLDEDGAKNSILFHLLAMGEKRIRDAMSSCFDKYPLQVHDAVYSYEDLPVEILEKAVKEQAGFAVKITKEVK